MAGWEFQLTKDSHWEFELSHDFFTPQIHGRAVFAAGGLATVVRGRSGTLGHAALDAGGAALISRGRSLTRARGSLDSGGPALVARGRSGTLGSASLASGGLALVSRGRCRTPGRAALALSGPALVARGHGVPRLYKKIITIDHTKVSADDTDFRCWVTRTTDSDLAARANADGSDIMFTDTSGAVLKFEIEKFVHATGELCAWVKMPSVSASVDTAIWLYYGAGTTTDNKQDATGVWSSEFLYVGHLNDTPPDVVRSIGGLQNIPEKIILIGGFLYYISGNGGNCVKINASTLAVTATLSGVFPSGAETATTDGTYLYVGEQTSPAKVTRIQLSNFTVVDSLTLNSGENSAAGMHIVGTDLYFSLGVNPGKVVKIDLVGFTRTAVVTLNSGEFVADESADDGTYLYVPTEAGHIVRIALSGFSRVDAVSLSPATDVQQTIVYNGYVYAICRMGFGSGNDGKLVRVPTSNFTAGAIQTITTVKESDEMFLSGSTLYVAGFYQNAPAVAKVDTTAFAEVARVNLPEGGRGEGIVVDGSYVYTIQEDATGSHGMVTRIDLNAFAMTLAQLTTKDSTANANRGLYAGGMPTGALIAGQLGGGLNFDGVDDYIELGFGDALKITGSMTLSGWFYRPVSLPAEAGLISRRVRAGSGGSTINYQLAWDVGGIQFHVANTTLTYSTSIAVGWHKIDAVWDDAAHTRTVYLDGASVANNSTAGSVQTSGTMHCNIANKPGNASTSWNSKADEVRIIAATRTAAQIATEYANQNSPSTFYSVSAEQLAT